MHSNRYLEPVQFITGTETTERTTHPFKGEAFAGAQEVFAGLLAGGALGAVGGIAYLGLRAILVWCFSG